MDLSPLGKRGALQQSFQGRWGERVLLLCDAGRYRTWEILSVWSDDPLAEGVGALGEVRRVEVRGVEMRGVKAV